jgi:DNA-binding FadR family transcriptional regulator
MSISDSELAAALGVSRPTARDYRQRLTALKLIETEEIKTGKVKEIRITRTKYA